MNVINIMYAAAAANTADSFYAANTAGTADNFGWVDGCSSRLVRTVGWVGPTEADMTSRSPNCCESNINNQRMLEGRS